MRVRPVDVLNSTIALRGLSVTRGIAYGPHARQRLDLYRPEAAAGPLPVAVFFYGGAWQVGDRADYPFVAAPLARRGVMVAVPDYRLFPEVRWPEFVADGARAVAHVHKMFGDAAIFAVGHSAGAYIAAMLALDPGWAVRETLAGAVGIAGPYDFLPIQGEDIRAVFSSATDLRDTQPIGRVDGANPPLLLLHGDADTTCYPRNSLALATRIRAHGGRAEARTYRGVGHLGIIAAFAPLLRWYAPTLADVAGFIGGDWASGAKRGI